MTFYEFVNVGCQKSVSLPFNILGKMVEPLRFAWAIRKVAKNSKVNMISNIFNVKHQELKA